MRLVFTLLTLCVDGKVDAQLANRRLRANVRLTNAVATKTHHSWLARAACELVF